MLLLYTTVVCSSTVLRNISVDATPNICGNQKRDSCYKPPSFGGPYGAICRSHSNQVADELSIIVMQDGNCQGNVVATRRAEICTTNGVCGISGYGPNGDDFKHGGIGLSFIACNPSGHQNVIVRTYVHHCYDVIDHQPQVKQVTNGNSVCFRASDLGAQNAIISAEIDQNQVNRLPQNCVVDRGQNGD